MRVTTRLVSIRSRSLKAVFSTLILLLSALTFASAASATTEHCADHQTATKVESEDSPATVSVVDTRTGDHVDVVVTISGTDFVVEAVDPAVELVDALWCIKSSTKTNDGAGLSGQSASTNKKGVVQAISYVVLYAVTTKDPTPVQECNETTNSGGQGITETAHELGETGPTAFLLEWETFNIPDQIEVLYEGGVIYDTGLIGDNINEGTGSDTINVPAGTSTQVVVRVTGPDAGTAWQYRVNCPE